MLRASLGSIEGLTLGVHKGVDGIAEASGEVMRDTSECDAFAGCPFGSRQFWRALDAARDTIWRKAMFDDGPGQMLSTIGLQRRLVYRRTVFLIPLERSPPPFHRPIVLHSIPSPNQWFEELL